MALSVLQWPGRVLEGIGSVVDRPRIGAVVGNPLDDRWWPTGSNYRTSGGVNVTTERALSQSPVWACVQRMAKAVAFTPILVFERQDDGGRERATAHPIYRLLHDEPNPYQTPYQFQSQLMVDRLLWGNFYARIELDPYGVPVALWPIHPDSVTKVELLRSGQIRYTYKLEDGTEQRLLSEEVLHVRGLSLNGIAGLSVINYAREAIGLSIAASEYGNGFFGGGPLPGGIFTHPSNLSLDAQKRLKASLESEHGGANRGKHIAILEEGMHWEPMVGMSNNDARLIETLRWTLEETGRFLDVPQHMINDSGATSNWGTGIDSLSQAFFTLSFGPELKNIGQEMTKSLIVDRDRYYAEFLPDALQWMTPSQRVDYNQKSAGGPAPYRTIAEVRRAENLPFIPGTDELLQPLNMGGRPDTTENQKQPNPANQAALASPSSVRARLVLEGVALRLVRKEIAAMSRQAARAAGDHNIWWEEIDAFYLEHADAVASTLHIPAAAARSYGDGQARALKAGGVKAMLDWETTKVVDLLALVDREKWEDQ